MPFGTAAMPGPGMMPMALGVLLMLSSAGLVVLELKAPATSEVVRLGNRHIALAVAAIVVSGWLFERAGLLLYVVAVPVRDARRAVAARLVAVAARRGGRDASRRSYFFSELLGVMLPPLPSLPERTPWTRSGCSTAATASRLRCARQHLLLLDRLPVGHGRRRAAGTGAAGRNDAAAAAHVSARSGVRRDHALRNFLRRHVRRIDHFDPGADSGRGGVGRHVHRRLRDGEAGTRGAGADDRRRSAASSAAR